MSQKDYLRSKHCKLCKTRLDTIKNKKTINSISQPHLLKLINDNKPADCETVEAGDLVCQNCIASMRRKSKKNSSNNIETNDTVPVPTLHDDHITNSNSVNNDVNEIDATVYNVIYKIISDIVYNENKDKNNSKKASQNATKLSINVPRPVSTHKSCFICTRKNTGSISTQKMKTMSDIEEILQIFSDTGILIQLNSRACTYHFNSEGKLKNQSIDAIKIHSNTTEMSKESMELLLEGFRSFAKRNSVNARFQNPSNLSEYICKSYTGFSKAEFLVIHGKLTSMRNRMRATTLPLAVYLFWLKTGSDMRTIAAIFELADHIEASRYIDQARTALMKDYVPLQLGPDVMPREEWVKHNTYIASQLFNSNDKNMIMIADATYCYCNKSDNNEVQRLVYSSQKKRHLVKIFVIVASDGHIIDISGPHEATKNDATIFRELLQKDNTLRTFIQEDDIVLLDRGFRDCLVYLESQGLNSQTPSLQTGAEQLTTEQANQSRIVTKCRWVIEVVNSHLKNSFHALSDLNANRSLSHIMIDYKIAAALINEFFKRLFSDRYDEKEIVSNIKRRLNQENSLESIIKENELHKASKFINIDSSSIKDFPIMSVEDIKTNITLGYYQIHQSNGYIAEHLKDGRYLIRVNKESQELQDFKILYASIQSRHRNRKTYRVYVKYYPQKNVDSWYCTCQTGRRTVGCCSHVASIIYYLSFGIYQTNIVHPSSDLIKIFGEKTIKSDISSESEDDNDENSKTENKKQAKLAKVKKINGDVSSDPDNETENEEDEIVLNVEDKSLLKNKKVESDIEFEKEKDIPKEAKTLKHSVTKEEINSKRKKTGEGKNSKNKSPEYQIIQHLPKWNGMIINSEIELINTCTIDYFLFAIWYAVSHSQKIKSSVNESNLEFQTKINNIVDFIDKKQFDAARTIWVSEICKLKPNKNTIDTYGTEYEFFIDHIKDFQRYILKETCKNEKCLYEFSLDFGDFAFVSGLYGNVTLNVFDFKNCNKCGSVLETSINFISVEPGWLLIEANPNTSIRNTDLPRILHINNSQYQLLLATFCTNGHFRGIFYLNDLTYLIDDRNKTTITTTIPRHSITSCFYQLV